MYVVIFLAFIAGILTRSQISLHYARLGFRIWYENMVPSLLPFMILSGIMVRTGVSEKITGFLYPVVGKCLKTSRQVCYVIFMGFLCGFPMGASNAAQLYRKSKITKQDALWLLMFCNNIGPVYFCSFVIPLLGIQKSWICLSAMYGIPFLYGVLLRFTLYRPAENVVTQNTEPDQNFLNALEEAVKNGVQNILTLGGYMVLFCLLNLLPHICKGGPMPLLGTFFEISSGLMSMNGRLPVSCLVLLSFGGLSCFAQTCSCLAGTDLVDHAGEYLLHKTLQAALVALYYFCVIDIMGINPFG